jgi:hypothetical protein
LSNGGILKDMLLINIQTNHNLNETEQLSVILRAKYTVVVNKTVSVAPGAGIRYIVDIDAKEITNPAGGVHILSIEGSNGLIYERLIFVMPKARFDSSVVKIDTDTVEYSPGDKVDLSIAIDTAQLSHFKSDE